MSLKDVYHLTEQQIDELYKMLAEGFKDDDLYRAIYPDDKKRAIFLKHFFKNYIQLIRSYCYFVADSKDINCIMVVFDSTKENKAYFARILWTNIKMAVVLVCVMHSLESIRRLMDCWDMFTSRWVNDFAMSDYLHMDLICTKETMKKKGLARNLIRHLIKEARERGCDVTMETHHADNLQAYKEEGFKLMSTISHERYHVTQYNMLYRVERGV